MSRTSTPAKTRKTQKIREAGRRIVEDWPTNTDGEKEWLTLGELAESLPADHPLHVEHDRGWIYGKVAPLLPILNGARRDGLLLRNQQGDQPLYTPARSRFPKEVNQP